MTEPSRASAEPTREQNLARQVRVEFERAIQRGIRVLEYVTAGDPAVGQTAKTSIWSRGTLKLYHYHAQADEVYRVPLLLVMSLVSKPYILDLAPGQSLVEFLVKKGFDVYMIDWGVPRPEDCRLRLEDYVLDFIPECIEKVARDSGEPEVSIIGYCMGGMLAAMYAALANAGAAGESAVGDDASGAGAAESTTAQGPLRNLVCFTTPVDFDGMGLFKRWTDPKHFDVDRIVDSLGNVPPELMYASFEMLKPAARLAGQVRLWDNMWNDDFVKGYRMFDRWAADQIPFPGECFRQTVKELMWENRLYKNELVLGGRPVKLERITVPFLHVMAEHDHIVPYASAKDLVAMVGSADKTELLLKGGHVSLVAGANAGRRLWPELDAWLAERSV
jgi:polyhydroxyalkanoate synthase subunit PhaC